MSKRTIAWWAFVVVALAAGGLLARSARQAVSIDGSGDLATVLAASRAWVHGRNPYDPGQLLREWDTTEERTPVTPDPSYTPSVYPPGTFVVMAPVATLTWARLRAVWVVLDVIMILAVVLAVPALARAPWGDPRAVALAAGVMLLGPFRNGLDRGQLAIAACALVVASALASRRRCVGTSGALLGLACALKPPLAAPFVLWHVLHRRWRLAATAVGLAGAFMLVGVIRLRVAGVAWLQDLRHNLLAATAPGAINDASEWNPDRFQMIDLRVLLHTLVEGRGAVTMLTLGLTALAAIVFARIVWRRGADDGHDRELAELAFVASWTLLPAPHRFYDAGLLVFVLAWSAAAWRTRQAPWAWGALLLVMSFAISPALWLTRALPRAAAPPYRYATGLEQLVLPVQVWALVLLCLLLLRVLSLPPSAQSLPRR